MDSLPCEIWNLIISFLNVKDRSNLMKINKFFNKLAHYLPAKWGLVKNTDRNYLNPPEYVNPIKMTYFIGDLRNDRLIIIDPRAKEVYIEFSSIYKSNVVFHRNIKKLKIRNAILDSFPTGLKYLDINGEVLTNKLISNLPLKMKYLKLSGLISLTDNFSISVQRVDIREANSNSNNITIRMVNELLLGDNLCDALILKSIYFIQINTLDLLFNENIIFSNEPFNFLNFISFQTIQLGILISLINGTVVGESLFPNVNSISIDVFSYSVAPWIQYENLSQIALFDSFLNIFPNLKNIYLSRPIVIKLNVLFNKNFFIKSKKINIIPCDDLPMYYLMSKIDTEKNNID